MRARAVALVCAALGAAAFAAVAVLVAVRGRGRWEHEVLRLAHEAETEALEQAMLGLAQATDDLGMAFLAGLAFLLLLRTRRVRDAVWFALAMATTGVLVAVLKSVFAVARPTLFEPAGPASGFAFPSGHAMTTTALVASLAFLARSRAARRALVLAGGVLVVAVGASRIFLAVHFPADVLAGWAASLAWVSALYLARQTLARPARSAGRG